MKKINILTIVFCIFLSIISHAQESQDATKLYNQAKVLLFDRNYTKALDILHRLIAEFPESPFHSRALFYRSKCLEEKKLHEAAIKSYMEFLVASKNESLLEEATIAIIDLDFKLYQGGEEKYLKPIKKFLKSHQRTVRYYAAFKLSYVSEKKVAREAVLILKNIISMEEDVELVDRAKLALMRINPDYVKGLSSPAKSIYSKNLYVSSYDKIKKKETFAFNIPFALAKLALDALPEEEKSLVKKRGYNLDKILDTLIKTGEIFRIESEESIFKVWIK